MLYEVITLGDGDIGAWLTDYATRRDASNDLYGPAIERFNQTPEAQQALRRALNMARIEWENSLGNRTDDMAAATREHLGKFFNPETTALPKGRPVHGGEGPTNAPQIIPEGQHSYNFV